MLIAVDIDEVTQAFAEHIFDFYNKLGRTNRTIYESEDYKFHKVWGCSIGESVRRIRERF